jgi:hypothetical protein
MIDCLKRADSVGQAVLALLCGGTGSAGWAGAHGRDGRALFSHRRVRAWLQLFPIGLVVQNFSRGEFVRWRTRILIFLFFLL